MGNLTMLFFTLVSLVTTIAAKVDGKVASLAPAIPSESEAVNLNRIGVETKKHFEVHSAMKMNWYDALVYCKSRHYDLATVRSEEENYQLLVALQKAGIPTGTTWIGGTRLSSAQEEFFWITDGRPVNNEYVNWQPGEPNNGNAHNERCVEYFYDPNDYHESNVAWNDQACASENYFACEYFTTY
uniref:Pulmonary surfactant-associated protein D n=1 Tax=Lygus hesperus TaxID=30085 RepID=A0A146M2D9_LYGHE